MSFIQKLSKNIAKLPTGMEIVSQIWRCGLSVRLKAQFAGFLMLLIRWRIIDEDVRRCLTHVFPYSILYTIELEFVFIVAVAHCAREPGYWKERLPIS
jgi:hypothetical protein